MPETVSPQIAAIRARYQASLPEKAVMIEQQIDILSDDGVSANDLNETHEVLHKLAGSAGMYGYHDVSILCRAAMSNASDQDVDALLIQLNELKNLLEQHS